MLSFFVSPPVFVLFRVVSSFNDSHAFAFSHSSAAEHFFPSTLLLNSIVRVDILKREYFTWERNESHDFSISIYVYGVEIEIYYLRVFASDE